MASPWLLPDAQRGHQIQPEPVSPLGQGLGELERLQLWKEVLKEDRP